MKVKLVLLFLFYHIFTVPEIYSQVFENNLHKKGDFFTKKDDLKENVKVVSIWEYYDVGHRLKFNLDALQYKQNSKPAYQSMHYDKDGTITSFESKNRLRNSRGQFLDIDNEFQREYDSDGHLCKRITFDADTLHSVVDLEYKYDDKNRIIEIIKTRSSNNGIYSSLEEVEYFEDGRKSTIYKLEDSIKIYRDEYVYDLNDKLVAETSERKNLNRGNRFRTDYFYSDDGRLDAKISFWYNPSMSIIEGFLNGWYRDYIYNDEGILKRVMSYDLEVENNDGEANYFKGELKSRSKYKEKKRGDNILQIVKYSRGNRPYRISRRVILDHHRNVILKYKTSDRSCTLEISEITYY